MSRSFEFGRAAGEITRRTGKVLKDLVMSMPVLVGTGVALWSYQTAGGVGLAINGGTAALTAAFCIYESLTGKPKGLPAESRTGLSLVSAATIIVHGALAHGSAEHFVMKSVLPAASNILAAAAWHLIGRQARQNTKPTNAVNDPLFYAALCEIPASISIVGASLKTAPFFAAALRAALPKQPENHVVASWADFAYKHLTPARICAVDYAVCAASTHATNPLATAYQLFWAAGFALWDKKENREFLPDVTRLLIRNSKPSLTPG